jgi:hypothetical protein
MNRAPCALGGGQSPVGAQTSAPEVGRSIAVSNRWPAGFPGVGQVVGHGGLRDGSILVVG